MDLSFGLIFFTIRLSGSLGGSDILLFSEFINIAFISVSYIFNFTVIV